MQREWCVSCYTASAQAHKPSQAFHLPNPARLPLVFLPAKFDSSDPLQRLAIAFMSKPAAPAVPNFRETKGELKRKRRRRSAPAKTLPGAASGKEHVVETKAGLTAGEAKVR